MLCVVTGFKNNLDSFESFQNNDTHNQIEVEQQVRRNESFNINSMSNIFILAFDLIICSS